MSANWRVPLVDLGRTTEPMASRMALTFARVRASGSFVLGPDVEAFERACAETLAIDHAIGVSSGTDALVATLLALDVQSGDEVIVPTFTFIASTEAVLRVGARPVLVDSAVGEFHVDSEAIERAIGPRTKAIMPVHLFGDCVEPAGVFERARAAGIAVVEDAAQAFGVRGLRGPAGTWGTAGCFSFFPTKTLGAMGDGGLVVTRDASLAERVRSVRQHGALTNDVFHRMGGNYRLDALQAALLHLRLDGLSEEIAQRRRGAALYRAALGDLDQIVLPRVADGATYNPFVVRIRRSRDRVERLLAAAGIQTRVYYRRPLHVQKSLAMLGHREGDFPNAELAAAEALALPLFPGIRDDEITVVVQEIRAILDGYARPG